MSDRTNDLRDALARGVAPGGNLADELAALGEYGVARPDDAEALADAIERWAGRVPEGGPALFLPLHLFTGLLQGVETREAFEVLRARGVPALLRAFDAALSTPGAAEGSETLLFLLKVAGMYRAEEAVERVVAAARLPLGVSSPLWPLIFGTFDDTHPYRLRLAQRLRGPEPPPGAIALAYLDFAGALAAEGGLTDHPFDTPAGHARLRAWLLDPRPGPAILAASNLPYLEPERRAELLSLADAHPDAGVRLKAASARARLGDEAALGTLADACLEPARSLAAMEALNDLGRGALIPPAARQPDFQAKAEMCAWLAHPAEWGEPPDAIELVDTRSADWPPTADRRRLWLFRFSGEIDGKPRAGRGLVGSITFSLRAETANLENPEDVYALHCCWELQAEGDPRAPGERSVEAGKAILRAFGWAV